MAHEVNEELKGAHRRFLTLVAFSALGLLVCFPDCSDAHQVRALRLTQAVVAQLDTGRIESEIVKRAESSDTMSLQAIAKQAQGKGVRGLSAEKAPSAMLRAAPVELPSLGAVVSQFQNGQKVTVAGPDANAIATGVRWRVGHSGNAEQTRLVSMRLLPGGASQTQLDKERAVEPLRVAAIDARRSYERDEFRHTRLKERVQALAKMKAPRKTQWKVQEKRREAYDEMEASKLAMETALASYHSAAEAALAFEPQSAGGPGVAVAVAMRRGEASSPSEVVIPVPRLSSEVVTAPVAVPPALVALAQEPLWKSLRDKNAEQALSQLQGGLSWHMWGTDLGILRVGGATLLHVYPLLLLGLLLRVWLQCRTVRRVFSPFNHPGAALPVPGTGKGSLDVVLIVAPVSIVVILDVWTLVRINTQWWIPFVLGAGTIAFSVVTALKWNDLKELRTNIVRTSLPPPPGD